MFGSTPVSFALMGRLGWILIFSDFLFFGIVLEELDRQPDLTNQVLEVAIDESGESVDIVWYELPTDK